MARVTQRAARGKSMFEISSDLRFQPMSVETSGATFRGLADAKKSPQASSRPGTPSTTISTAASTPSGLRACSFLDSLDRNGIGDAHLLLPVSAPPTHTTREDANDSFEILDEANVCTEAPWLLGRGLFDVHHFPYFGKKALPPALLDFIVAAVCSDGLAPPLASLSTFLRTAAERAPAAAEAQVVAWPVSLRILGTTAAAPAVAAEAVLLRLGVVNVGTARQISCGSAGNLAVATRAAAVVNPADGSLAAWRALAAVTGGGASCKSQAVMRAALETAASGISLAPQELVNDVIDASLQLWLRWAFLNSASINPVILIAGNVAGISTDIFLAALSMVATQDRFPHDGGVVAALADAVDAIEGSPPCRKGLILRLQEPSRGLCAGLLACCDGYVPAVSQHRGRISAFVGVDEASQVCSPPNRLINAAGRIFIDDLSLPPLANDICDTSSLFSDCRLCCGFLGGSQRPAPQPAPDLRTLEPCGVSITIAVSASTVRVAKAAASLGASSSASMCSLGGADHRGAIQVLDAWEARLSSMMRRLTPRLCPATRWWAATTRAPMHACDVFDLKSEQLLLGVQAWAMNDTGGSMGTALATGRRESLRTPSTILVQNYLVTFQSEEERAPLSSEASRLLAALSTDEVSTGSRPNLDA